VHRVSPWADGLRLLVRAPDFAFSSVAAGALSRRPPPLRWAHFLAIGLLMDLTSFARRYPRLDHRVAWLLGGVSLVALASHFYPFLSDDALISLRYSQRLIEGRGLTWDDYEKVEGYTNLLWILLCALPMKLGADGIWTARVLDMIGAGVAVFAVTLGPVRLKCEGARAWFGGLFLATLVPLSVWAIGGLEHGFMAGVIVVGLLLVDRARHRSRDRHRAFLWAAIPWALLVLLRADGAVLVAALAAGFCLSSRFAWATLRDLALLVGPATALWASQMLFRIWYYGDFIPNTARVKVALNEARLLVGLNHVKAGLAPLLPALGLLLLLLFLTRGKRAYRVVPAITLFIGWTTYVVFVGGDIFPGWRQLLLGLVPLGFALATLGERALRQQQATPLLWSLVLLVLFGGQLNAQMKDSENVRAKKERWEWEGYSVGPALKRAFAEKEPLLAVDAAGALPYWTGFPSLDLLGLNDRYLATHPPEWHGRDAAIGHDLGDPDYFLRRAPDIFAFCNAAGAERPCFQASRLLLRRREFRENYRFVRFRGIGPKRAIGGLYIRLDGRLGIREELLDNSARTRIVYPGYLLASVDSGALATLRDNSFVVHVSAQTPGVIKDVRLPAGSYLVRADAEAPILYSTRCMSRSGGAAATRIVVNGDETFDLLVAPRDGAQVIEKIEFESTDEAPSHSCHRSTRVAAESAAINVGASVAASALDSFQEGTSWLAPPAVLFDMRGVRVELGQQTIGKELWIVSDNNDELNVKFTFEGNFVTAVTVPVVPEPGMRLRRITLSGHLNGQQVDEAVVTPRRGDGSYSLSGFALR
jgi:arabinofuranosyltransferase